MKKLSLLLSLAFMLGLVAACGYQEAVTQRSDVAYLRFSGETRGISIQIDNGNLIDLESYEWAANPEQQAEYHAYKLYKIKPGKHVVEAFRDGKLLLRKLFFIANQETVEIELP